jgi:protein phosphatase
MDSAKLELFLASDVGLVRHRNEDIAGAGAVFVRNETRNLEVAVGEAPYVIGVADGVGGGNMGDEASKQVLGSLLQGLPDLEAGLDDEALGEAVRKTAKGAHDELMRQGMLNEKRAGMATTATLVLFYEGRRYLVHAGDSRLYAFENGMLQQLSRDHTLREFSGNLNIPGNILVNCYGAENDFFIDFFRLGDRFEQGGIYVLCSDGLSDMLGDERMEAILAQDQSLEDTGNQMVEEARAAGGSDNITVVLAKTHE